MMDKADADAMKLRAARLVTLGLQVYANRPRNGGPTMTDTTTENTTLTTAESRRAESLMMGMPYGGGLIWRAGRGTIRTAGDLLTILDGLQERLTDVAAREQALRDEVEKYRTRERILGETIVDAIQAARR